MGIRSILLLSGVFFVVACVKDPVISDLEVFDAQAMQPLHQTVVSGEGSLERISLAKSSSELVYALSETADIFEQEIRSLQNLKLRSAELRLLREEYVSSRKKTIGGIREMIQAIHKKRHNEVALAMARIREANMETREATQKINLLARKYGYQWRNT